MVPAHQAQQLALEIAAPLLGMIIILVGVIFVLLQLSLSGIVSSVKSLTREAERISQGELDNTLRVGGHDEISRLRNAFEKMRQSLKARLDELGQLLVVSQGVASSLELEEALEPILDSARSLGVSSARVVLADDVLPQRETDEQVKAKFGDGPDTAEYRYFDDDVLFLMKESEREHIALTHPVRNASFRFGPNAPRLGSVLAVALRHEQVYYGVFVVRGRSAAVVFRRGNPICNHAGESGCISG